MAKRRSLETRIKDAKEKLDRMETQVKIQELRGKLGIRRRPKRR